eukprot:3023805-Lingulodinium_polyedra.AAC.1
MATSYVANVFYTMHLPDSLARVFRLPPLQAAGACGLATPGQGHAARAHVVQPYLTVLPSGWAGAFHVCQ